jgi:hypothetical protein
VPAVLFSLLLIAATASPQAVPQPGAQPSTKLQPSLKPVAETRLLMEGLANSNFRGMEKLLKTEPTTPQTWTFLRGQALLIAETANLLMIRPPKGEAQSVWFARAMNLREVATVLAATVAEKDYAKSKAMLGTLAKSCNGCHQTSAWPSRLLPLLRNPFRARM